MIDLIHITLRFTSTITNEKIHKQSSGFAPWPLSRQATRRRRLASPRQQASPTLAPVTSRRPTAVHGGSSSGRVTVAVRWPAHILVCAWPSLHQVVDRRLTGPCPRPGGRDEAEGWRGGRMETEEGRGVWITALLYCDFGDCMTI